VSNFLGRKNTRKSTRKKGRGGFPLTRPSCRESTGVPRPKSGTLPRSSSGKRPRELVERDGFYFDKQRFFLRTVFPRFIHRRIFLDPPLDRLWGPHAGPAGRILLFLAFFPGKSHGPFARVAWATLEKNSYQNPKTKLIFKKKCRGYE